MMAGIRPQSILMLCAYAATPLWLVWIFGHLYMQDLTLRQFYGEGDYVRSPADHMVMGNSVGVHYLKELRAKQGDDMQYQCLGVTNADGTKPSLSFQVKGEPVCCSLAAFFKIVVAQSCFKQPLFAPARVSRAAPDLASRHR